MRILKLGLISFVGISLVILVLSLLIPADTRVSRAITIAAPADSVKVQTGDIRNMVNWNRLLQDSGLTGIQTTKENFNSDQMQVNLNQKDSVWVMVWKRKGQEPVSGAIVVTPSGTDTSIVQWYFDFKVSWYPWEKFGSIIFDKQLGPPMEASLDRLRKTCEQAP